jgi:hypothetical protein
LSLGGQNENDRRFDLRVPAFPVRCKAPPAQQSLPEDVAAVCHHCEWVKIQIGDIDEKIAGWKRQTATLHRVSDLSDPGRQNALNDIANRIAKLEAKKAQLEAELPDCLKRCKEATEEAKAVPPPVTVMPGGNGPGNLLAVHRNRTIPTPEVATRCRTPTVNPRAKRKLN